MNDSREHAVETKIRNHIRDLAAWLRRSPRIVVLFAEDFDVIARGKKRLHRWGAIVKRGPQRGEYQ